MRTPQSRLRLVLVGLIVALLMAGCGSSGPTASTGSASTAPSSGPTRIPYLIDAQDYVGQTRFLFGMLHGEDSIGSPSLPVNVAFYDVAKSTSAPVTTADATFIWAIPNAKGIYAVATTFAEAGDWIAEFTSSAAGLTEKTRVQFPVEATTTTPLIGAKAPDAVTPTLADVGGNIKAISSDPTPDPDFYKVSVPDAIAQHKPFVLVFATPAFCTSRQCGPTLDSLKAVAAAEPGMTFINVEPYQMKYANGSLQPILDATGNLQANSVTTAWGLISEPWIFVVDKSGIVRGSYSLIVGADELKAAIASVL